MNRTIRIFISLCTIVLVSLIFISATLGITLDDYKKYKGEGAAYLLHDYTGENHFALAIVGIDGVAKHVVIEVFAKSDIAGKGLFQQFVFAFPEDRPVINKAYIMIDGQSPMTIPATALSKTDNLRIEDFLTKKDDLQSGNYGKKIGTETIHVPAGATECIHYQHKGDGCVVDFWLSDQVLPIGIVKLKSRGSKQMQNYTLELTKVLSGVGQAIDETRVVPLSEEMKQILNIAVKLH
ncbi:MAG: hypothetical protein V1753_03660 [Pseudomonadota bacterium]